MLVLLKWIITVQWAVYGPYYELGIAGVGPPTPAPPSLWLTHHIRSLPLSGGQLFGVPTMVHMK